VFELTEARLQIERQKAIPQVYKGVTVDCAYRADLVVEGCVPIEVKAQEGRDKADRERLSRRKAR
jgi:GxxExxY protein